MSVEKLLSECNFSMLKGKIDDQILKSLKNMRLEKPTRIQAETLPHLLLGRDIIGAAKTGSGKTLAFLIPVVDNLIKLGFTKKHGTGCVILSPTRELALQTNGVLKSLLSDINLSHCLIVGGEKKSKDILTLRKGANIIVSTPGRLFDHLQHTENFNCDNLKCLVIDEADKLLEAGFEKHITGIINLLPTKRQTILFSATIDNKVENLARLALKANPVLISINDETQATVTGLQQGYCICPVEYRIPWLYKMLKKSKKLKVMVFFSSCKSVDFHYEFFKVHCKAPVLSIHGQQSQSRRKEAYQSFVEAGNGVLFCTDVAARGLDIPSVDWIVQYDPPTDPKVVDLTINIYRSPEDASRRGETPCRHGSWVGSSRMFLLFQMLEIRRDDLLLADYTVFKEYIHRVGRTARGLNQEGNAVIVLRPEEEEFVSFLQKEKVYLDKYSFGDPSSDVQEMLEDLITNNGVIKILARKAYLSFLRCYKKHPLKKIFNIKTMDLRLAAKAFGFTEQPDVDFRILLIFLRY